MNKLTGSIVDQRKIGAKSAATTYTSCQSDRHCSVTQVQATADDSGTTYEDNTEIPNFTFLIFANSVLNRNKRCCSPKLDKLSWTKVRAF
jgi:hypothetical protein